MAEIPELKKMNVILLNSKGEPQHVFVFNNNEIISDNQFNETEKLYLEKYSPKISSADQIIHTDDTIRTIKRKIIKELGFNNVSYEEIYLFSKMNTQLQFPVHYKQIVKGGQGIPKHVLGQLIMNLQLLTDDEQIKYLNELNLDFYSYKDIETSLHLDNRNIVMNIPIGQRFALFNDILFSANPFHVLPHTENTFTMTSENPLITFENSLFLNYHDAINNTIYVCLAEDVLNHTGKKGINDKQIIQSYFPLLTTKNIQNAIQLSESKQALIDETKNKMEKISDTHIDTLYEIAQDPFKTPYIKKGVKEFSLTLHPEHKILIPLENIFKQSHATETRPFIKYKPGFKKEELYRLHSIGFSNDGRKIPSLSKQQIATFSKKRYTSLHNILFVMKHTMNEVVYHAFCWLSNTGNITFEMSISDTVNTTVIETLFIEIVNPLITEINQFLQTNSKLRQITSLDNPLIEASKVHYVSQFQSSSPLSNSDLLSMTQVFNIIEFSKNGTTSLRYKRVSNYTEMNELNALINQLYKQNTNMENIIELIMINFSLSEEEARIHITNYLNEFTIINGNYVNKSVDVADNPGFPVSIQYNDIENYIIVDFNNIDSLHYIECIEQYIDALVKLSTHQSDIRITKTKLDYLKRKPRNIVENEETTNIIIAETDGTKPGTGPIIGILEEIRDMDDIDDDDDGIFFDDDDDDEEGDEDEGDEDEGQEDEGDEDEGQEEEEEEKEEEEKEEEEKEEEEEEEDISIFGGEKKDKGGNTFSNKRNRLEPELFINQTDGNYAKICPGQSERQPVILTEEEKEAIDNDPEAKQAYGIAMKYGSDVNKQFWYMCPRFWCLKTNKPMTDEQVKNGECGGKIIPKKAKMNVPAGHYIYEFTDDRQHTDAEGKYIYYNPGFLDKSKSSGDKGIPCCFRNPFSVKQNTLRQHFGLKDDDISHGSDNLITGEKNDKTRTDRNYLNVLSIERVPIPSHRWGFLPLSVELFLRTDNSTSTDATNPTFIKKNESPLLRYGVERSKKKSFIACIADIYTFHNDVSVPTISEMIEIIGKTLTIDLYIKAQNGALVAMFQPKRVNISDIEIEDYRQSDFYKSIDLENPQQLSFLKFTIASYKQFLEFIADDDSIVDHTFLWDIISSPESGLFKNGLNIAIMEVEDNDIRDNIGLICPTNSYNDTLYDSKRGTILLIKHDEYYEPVYVYGNTRNERASNKTNAVKIFYSENTPTKLVSVLKNIENSISKYCKPANKPKTYNYKTNIPLSKIIDTLNDAGLTIHEQVMNYRSKIIGVMVSELEESSDKLFVPCAPSIKMKKMKLINIDDVEWLEYSTTIQMLQSISSRTERHVLCAPIAKVEEDGMIVGIITETNQMIMISSPEQNTNDDGIDTIQTNSHSKFYQIDKTLTSSIEVDGVREKTVRNIKLETKFYLQFRDKLRDELGNMLNNELSNKILTICNSKEYIYEIKLRKLMGMVKQLIEPIVNFVEFSEDILNTLYKNNELHPNNKHGFCVSKENQLCVPDKNLMTGENNEEHYYMKLCDELVRFSRVRTFMFEPSYLKMANIDYKVLSDEALLLHSHVMGDYFDNLSSDQNNKYIQSIPYEIAVPSKQTKTSKKISLDEQETVDIYSNIHLFDKECISKTIPIPEKENWNHIFTNMHKKLVLNKTPLCSFFAIANILKTHADIEENIHSIKQRLIQVYTKLLSEYPHYTVILYSILSKQFKKMYISKIQKKMLTIETMIMNDSYVITHIDLWVLCNEMNLPVVLFSDNNYKTMKLKTNYIVLGGNADVDNYTFVHTEPYKTNDIYPSAYSIIQPAIPLRTVENVIMTKQTLYDYLNTYKMPLRVMNKQND